MSHVPGTFELPLGAQRLAQLNDLDAIICLGCVIQGETRHFDFICQAAADGIMRVGLQYDKPVSFWCTHHRHAATSVRPLRWQAWQQRGRGRFDRYQDAGVNLSSYLVLSF